MRHLTLEPGTSSGTSIMLLEQPLKSLSQTPKLDAFMPPTLTLSTKSLPPSFNNPSWAQIPCRFPLGPWYAASYRLRVQGLGSSYFVGSGLGTPYGFLNICAGDVDQDHVSYSLKSEYPPLITFIASPYIIPYGTP